MSPARRSTARRCAVCSHPRRGQIAKALGTGMQTPVGVAAIHGLTPVQVFEHIEQCGGDVLEDDPAHGPLVTGRTIQRGLLALLQELLNDMEGTDRLGYRVKLAAEIRMTHELLAKLSGSIGPDTAVNVAVTNGSAQVFGSDEWAELCRLYADQPTDTAEERLALAEKAAELWPVLDAQAEHEPHGGRP
ncbi:hypothetical protein [Streptomyces hydrogenans]|uniref:hypothetical protein n=1 Tax=Streptomyces hydrogenans TaxID=1873719 RepID=UPI0038049C87